MKEYVLPFRDFTVSPGMTVPIYLDNELSVAAINAAAADTQRVVLTVQRTWAYPDGAEDLFPIGTIGNIVQVLRLPDGATHVIVHTTGVVRLSNIENDDDIYRADVTPIEFIDDMTSEQTIALRDRVLENIQALPAQRKAKTERLRDIIHNYPLPAFVDAVIQMFHLDTEVSTQILQAPSWREKMVMLLEQIALIAETQKIEESINKRINQQMESGRREAILQEKMRAIQHELGDNSEESDSISLRKRIEEAKLPTDAYEKVMSEFKRMRSMSPTSAEGALLKAYIEEVLAMPWHKSDVSPIDLGASRAALDDDHSGMTPIKERILEHIAVMKKTGRNSGSILCFVGAPGVGKTSLCKSIAKALGRKYHRISLGGIADESHLRGHRKTYIASQPGRIMDALKRCKTNNPVIVLDEIDKMGRDMRGDPEAALLEVLDPEQNKMFRDHYLEVDFDLSNVMFIATANSLNMSTALKDRMEIIEIPGYSVDEKVCIAREHLIARAAEDTGWDTKNIIISDDAIRHIIANYTAEEGVRQLQREITAMLRRALLENDGEDVKTEFTPTRIDALLSVRKSAAISKRIGFTARA